MKILVVDDHVLIREALHGVLKKLTRDPVVLEASNALRRWKPSRAIRILASFCLI